MSNPNQAISASCTIKYKSTSGGTYTPLISVCDFEPDNIKLGTIKLKRSLQGTNRWRVKKAGDPEAGTVKVMNVWDDAEYEIIRALQAAGTQAYWQLEINDHATKSKWERIGHVSEIDEPKAKQSEEGGEEVLWGFTIEITGQPTYTAGTG
jgi:hypothetical protein